MNVSTRFIIIDDDEFNNRICTVTLEKMSDSPDIKTFLDPLAGFNYIAHEYGKPGMESAILFLDINMPVMNGWQFLERFAQLDDGIKKRIKIYILSSSVDKRDMEKAKQDRNVIHYLVKPLTRETIRLITYSQNRDKKA